MQERRSEGCGEHYWTEVEGSEEIVRANKRKVEDIDNFIPFEKWALAKKILAPTLSAEQLELQWQDMLLRLPQSDKLWSRGQWLARDWGGVVVKNVDSQGIRTSVKRKKLVDGPQDLDELTTRADDAFATNKAAATPYTTGTSTVPKTDDHLISGMTSMPASSASGGAVAQLIMKRELANAEMLKAALSCRVCRLPGFGADSNQKGSH